VLGLAAALVLGLPVLSGWVLYAEVLYVVTVATGIAYFGPLGKRIQEATGSGNDALALRMLQSSSLTIVTIVDSLILLAILYLMLFKPA
jgi:uncharacterized membrane protein